MHLLRDLHPTLLSALEGIVDQVHSLFALYTQYSMFGLNILHSLLANFSI